MIGRSTRGAEAKQPAPPNRQASAVQIPALSYAAPAPAAPQAAMPSSLREGSGAQEQDGLMDRARLFMQSMAEAHRCCTRSLRLAHHTTSCNPTQPVVSKGAYGQWCCAKQDVTSSSTNSGKEYQCGAKKCSSRSGQERPLASQKLFLCCKHQLWNSDTGQWSSQHCHVQHL